MSFPGWAKLLGWLPLWNTVILVTSSVTVHIAHTGLKNNNRKQFIGWLALSVLLGMIFLVLQVEEYVHAYQHMGLTLESGIYGTTFFMLDRLSRRSRNPGNHHAIDCLASCNQRAL